MAHLTEEKEVKRLNLMLNLAPLVILLTTAVAHAEPGDKLYVQPSEASVHAGPSSMFEVVMQLRQGHALIEFQRLGPGQHRVLGSDFKEVTYDISEEDGQWVNVGIADSGGKDGWIRAIDVGFAPQPGPVYDSNAYCSEVALSTGGSYSVEKGCLDNEKFAKAAVELLEVEPRIMEYCDEVSSLVGGSYSILYGCIEIELEARAELND